MDQIFEPWGRRSGEGIRGRGEIVGTTETNAGGAFLEKPKRRWERKKDTEGGGRRRAKEE